MTVLVNPIMFGSIGVSYPLFFSSPPFHHSSSTRV